MPRIRAAGEICDILTSGYWFKKNYRAPFNPVSKILDIRDQPTESRARDPKKRVFSRLENRDRDSRASQPSTGI